MRSFEALRDTYWPWGAGLFATSLGPRPTPQAVSFDRGLRSSAICAVLVSLGFRTGSTTSASVMILVVSELLVVGSVGVMFEETVAMYIPLVVGLCSDSGQGRLHVRSSFRQPDDQVALGLVVAWLCGFVPDSPGNHKCDLHVCRFYGGPSMAGLVALASPSILALGRSGCESPDHGIYHHMVYWYVPCM